MAAAMGVTRHVPVDWTKESELNSWSHEENVAGFWFSGPDSIFNLTNIVFNHLRLQMEPDYGHLRDVE